MASRLEEIDWLGSIGRLAEEGVVAIIDGAQRSLHEGNELLAWSGTALVIARRGDPVDARIVASKAILVVDLVVDLGVERLVFHQAREDEPVPIPESTGPIRRCIG